MPTTDIFLGSPKLCHGVKDRVILDRIILDRIEMKSLSEVSKGAFNIESRTTLENNVRSSMADPNAQMEKVSHYEVLGVSFSNDGLLELVAGVDGSGPTLVLPTCIVRELTQKPDTKTENVPESKRQRLD